MKTAFLLGAIVGLGGVLAAAHYYPWVDHPRLASQTSVVANGGRAEQFLIRLPADRIAAAGSDSTGLRGAPVPHGVVLPARLAESPVLLEHFKVRDRQGNVIGVAARHWTETADGTATAWSVVIPSRGALLLAAPGEASDAFERALRSAGYTPGTPWNGDLRIEALDPGGAGRVVGGSDEFDALQGSYSETWTISGVTETGEIRGTIALGTVTRRGS